MPHQADDSERSNVTPSPELNPLLNPVLGQNMGRWAEVYFTSPPDQREQAVLELLRELKAQDSAREEDPTPARAAWDQPRDESHAVEGGASQAGLIDCRSCGYENPSQRNYCGMCGSRLEGNETPHPDVWPALIPPESSLPGTNHEIRSSNDDLPRFESAPARGSYLFYVGGALALVVLTLGWWAWHGGRSASGSNAPPQVPQSRAQQPAVATPIKPSIIVSDRGTSPGSSTGPGIVTDQPIQPLSAANSTAEASPQQQVVQESGAEELDMAKSYLTGTAVHGPDSNQAVEWLWKAVAKGNTEAPLLLSDLYLKGEGVQKNCEQARILLDAAARKGTKDAAERLQNLHSFGCD